MAKPLRPLMSIGLVLVLGAYHTLGFTSEAGVVPRKAEGTRFTAELVEVYPWCDHMPIMPASGENRQLVVTLALKNKTSDPIEVRLATARLSFDAGTFGDVVAGLSVMGHDGMASGETRILLNGSEEKHVTLRGDRLFAEGYHGQTLYVTLDLTAGEERLTVRHAGVVLVTD